MRNDLNASGKQYPLAGSSEEKRMTPHDHGTTKLCPTSSLYPKLNRHRHPFFVSSCDIQFERFKERAGSE